MKKLIIIRGPSGSGKTTIGGNFNYYQCEADAFFTDRGRYKFDASKLRQAHALCKLTIECHMFHGQSCIVSNTATKKWEVEPYLELAKEYGYEVEIIRTPGPWDAQTLAERNTHDVPLETIERQIARYEPYEDETEWTTTN